MTTPSSPRFFPGFDSIRIDTGEAVINGITGGNGPPLLLLHGWPQTHVIWHRVAPLLARDFTVVATDLRGYGDSSKPADGTNHEGYSKRAMARDQVAVMKALGHERFALVGHDRGGRVGHRMALDHPNVVSRLAVLDIVPTHTVYSTITRALGLAYFHWFLLPQPAPMPETLLGNNIDFFLRSGPFRGLIPQAIPDEIFAEYLRCASDPATLHAMCEDYRAAATIDLDHDQADLQRRIECPTLVLWGQRGAMHALYDVLSTWQPRAGDVRGKPLACGHWMPEEAPDDLARELTAFLR